MYMKSVIDMLCKYRKYINLVTSKQGGVLSVIFVSLQHSEFCQCSNIDCMPQKEMSNLFIQHTLFLIDRFALKEKDSNKVNENQEKRFS